MKRAIIILIILGIVAAITGCDNTPQNAFDIGSIQSYKDIPGVTEDEIAAIEALKEERDSFSYAHLLETEAYERISFKTD